MEKFNPDLYNILGRYSENASPRELKEAFRTFAKLYHPDKNQDDKVAAEEKMKQLNEAYEILKDPVKRAEYNARLLAHNKELQRAEAEHKQKAEAERKQKAEEERKRKADEEAAKQKVNFNWQPPKANSQRTATNTVNNTQSPTTPNSGSGMGALAGAALTIVALGLLFDALSDKD